jgi:RNA polymerase sigma factor (TIGR02999 family)
VLVPADPTPPDTGEPQDITGLLRQLSEGRRDALDRLIPVVYHELRRIAHAQLRGEQHGHTLNTTALVHEAYLKLVGVDRVEWRDRAHFFAAAAGSMRRILIDYARARKRVKRGGEDAVQVPLVEALYVAVERSDDLLALDEALTRLETQNQRQSRVVECRCFAGLSVEETAAALDISPATVKRDWDFSRAWLNRELGTSAGKSTALNAHP